MKIKTKDVINIQDAIENLEVINSLDLDAPRQIGLWKKTHIVTDASALPEGAIDWIEEEDADLLLEILDTNFRSVHEYLIFLSTSPEVDLRNAKALGIVERTVSLAASAAHKIELYLNQKLGRAPGKIKEREEFRELSNFFNQYFSAQTSTSDEKDAPRVDAEGPTDDFKKSMHRPEYKAMLNYYQSQFTQERVREDKSNAAEIALKNINEVRMDKDYELFCIRHEDGMPFYDLSMLRDMRLECSFDSDLEGFEADPLLQVRSILDRDAAAAASQIVEGCHQEITDFYKALKKMINNELAATLGNMCTALFLSQNPRNLLQNSNGKTSLQYFEDFHRFLRHSFRTSEYQRLVAYPPEKSDKMAHTLLNLVHSISRKFFLRSSGVHQETIRLIQHTAQKGSTFESKSMKEVHPSTSFWAKCSLEDEAFRTLLSKFPSGPLLKTLDLIRDEEEESVPFDPNAQGNYPFKLFEVGSGATQIKFLHMACPTRQAIISRAEVVDEFRGLLRSYLSSSPVSKHLLINLQDRTSWKELARCNALQGMEKSAEFNKVLLVATLPKHTEFYHQAKNFAAAENSEQFMVFLANQSEENGFSLPTSFKATDFVNFSEKIGRFIHKNFFAQKKSLTSREREDFIEIYDLFFSLNLINYYRPVSVSFTCKDGVDTGAAQTAAMFAFLKLLQNGFSEKKDRDTFCWLCYHSALLARERAINPESLHRILSLLQTVDAALQKNGKEIKKEMAEFFKADLLKNLEIID